MTRLTPTTHLHHHNALRQLWTEYPQAFSLLNTRDQRYLHAFYAPSRIYPNFNCALIVLVPVPRPHRYRTGLAGRTVD